MIKFKNFLKVMLTTVIMIVLFSPGSVFADLSGEVDKQAQPLLAGFLRILSWAGVFGTVISAIFLAVNSDENTGKKLKVTLVFCIFAMAIGFAAQGIFIKTPVTPAT